MKFQCTLCQFVYEKEHEAASVNIGDGRKRCLCKSCARLIMASLKEIKKDDRN